MISVLLNLLYVLHWRQMHCHLSHIEPKYTGLGTKNVEKKAIFFTTKFDIAFPHVLVSFFHDVNFDSLEKEESLIYCL